ncbi:MAG: hypothetical protein LBG76_10185 [Treponema sp.]|nr:hypothetical protein [Treponema sp.]
MAVPQDKSKLIVWRLIAVIICLIWIISFLVRIFVLHGFNEERSIIPFNVYLGLCALTGVMLVVLMIYPYQFYIHAAFCLLWGLARLIDGGGLSALLIYLAGYPFLYRQGFFKTRRVVKLTAGGIALTAAVIAQIRFGWEILALHLFQFLDFGLVICVAAIIFRREIRQILKPQKDQIFHLSSTLFSEKDLDILEKILSGQKYEAIALDTGQSISAVKKQIRGMFFKLQVNDRISFICRYSNYRFIRDV